MHLLIAIAGALVLYAMFVLVSPRMDCGRCNGWGQKQKRRRRAACSRCSGTGRQFRPGARLVAKGAALVIRYIRARRDDGR